MMTVGPSGNCAYRNSLLQMDCRSRKNRSLSGGLRIRDCLAKYQMEQLSEHRLIMYALGPFSRKQSRIKWR